MKLAHESAFQNHLCHLVLNLAVCQSQVFQTGEISFVQKLTDGVCIAVKTVVIHTDVEHQTL